MSKKIIDLYIDSGYSLKEKIDREYRENKQGISDFLPVWNEEVISWSLLVSQGLDKIFGNTIESQRFKHVQPSAFVMQGNVKWNEIRNLLEARIKRLCEVSDSLKGGSSSNNSAVIAGGNIHISGDLLQHAEKQNVTNYEFPGKDAKSFWTIFFGVTTLIVGIVAWPQWSVWLGYETAQNYSDKPVTQSHTGSGDNVSGDKNVTYSVASLPSRELNEQVATCILDQLSKIGGRRVSFELYGSWVTVKNETGGGMFGQPPDNETVNFTNEVTTLLKENNYQVDETYTSISSFSVDELAFTGFLIKKGNDEGSIFIHIGPNDGRQITCI